MGSVKYFTSINFYSRYWQCHIADKDILKTAFLMRYNLYKWVIMPMGFVKAPAIFIHTINNLFSNVLDCSMTVFLGDILVYSYMVKEHFTLLEKVLEYLHQYMFCCKLKKCSFICSSTIFPGFDDTLKGM